MKAVSQAFFDAWIAKQGKGGFSIVQYKRRFWNEAAQAFQYEANWTQYTMRQFVEIGNITFKLDTPLLNEIKTSSLILKFKNSDYQLLQTNSTSGILAPDAASMAVQPANPALGYTLKCMKFQILFGYKKADSTVETTTMFTGVVVDDNFQIDAGYAEITVSGNEYLLQSADAQFVSFQLPLVSGSIAGGNAVGQPTVSVGANPPYKYTTSVTTPAPTQNLPSPYASTVIIGTGVGLQATGFNVYDSGRTVAGGYPNGSLLSQGLDYTLSGTSTAGGVVTITLGAAPLGTITYTARQWYVLPAVELLVTLLAYQAGFTAAQINISPVIFSGAPPGPIITNIGVFTGTNYTAAWTQRATGIGSGGSTTSVSASGGVLSIGGNGPVSWKALDTPATPAVGIWTFNFNVLSFNPAGMVNSGGGGVVMFLSTQHPTADSGGPLLRGYGLHFNTNYNAGGSNQIQLKRYDNQHQSDGTLIANLGTFLADGVHAYSVGRDAAGNMTVTRDGVILGTGLDNNYTTCLYFGLSQANFGGTGDQFNCSIDTIANTFSVVLSMADFTGLTCYDAVQQLAKLANYEWGFDSTGAMYFRSKTPANLSPITQPNGTSLPLDQSDGVSKLLEFRTGMADVINDAQVQTPGFTREYNSSTLPEASPTSQQLHLTQILAEDYSDFQLAFDPVIAASRAQQIHDENYRQRRRARIKSKIMPFVELSDVLNFSFYNRPIMRDNIFGDPLQTWGGAAFGVPQNVLARNLPGKLIGMILDLNTCTGEYEIQEVLP